MGENIQLVKVPSDVWPSRRDWRAKVVAVHKKPGDHVYRGELLAELELEKVVIEVDSPVEGRVLEVFVNPGDQVGPGDPIASISLGITG